MPSLPENHPDAPNAPIRVSKNGGKDAFISWEVQESTDNPPPFFKG
jgi:hypothetical protein